jgi:hypothetical protein
VRLSKLYVRQGELYVFQPTSGDVGTGAAVETLSDEQTRAQGADLDIAAATKRYEDARAADNPREGRLAEMDLVSAKQGVGPRAQALEQQRQAAVDSAVSQGKPVHKDLLERWAKVPTSNGFDATGNIPRRGIPEGYVRQGELYVFQPTVTTPTETPIDAANVDGGSQGVQTESAEGSIPAVTENTVPISDIPSTAENRGAGDEPFGKLPTEEVETELSRRTKQAEEEEAREKIEAPKRRAEAIQTFVSEGAVVQTRKRVVGRAKAREGGGDVTRTEHFLVHPDRREIPLSASEAKKVSTAAPRSPAANLVSFTAANGQKLVGEVQSVTGNKATVAYQWNGKTKTQVVPVSQLGSPVASVATPPKYQYNQEQNTRKLGKHFPTALGVHANHDFRKSFASMAKDTALGQDYQMIAKLLSNMPEFKNMDLHLVADENQKYAGEYSWNKGKPSIAINLRLIARGQVDALGSILHEALHHITLAKVRNPQGAFENEVVSKLDLIRESVREYAESKGFGERLDYELGSTEEFITALFTRPDFQALIASIPDSAAPAVAVGKFRSLLSEIFRLIAELVHGKPVLRGSALEQAMTTSLALFNTPFRAIETGGLEALNAARSPGKGIKALFPQTGDKAAKPPELGERWWATTTRAEARSVLEPAALEELKAIAVRMDENPNQPKAKLIDRLVQITGVYADAVGIRGADAVGPRGTMPDYTGQAAAAQQRMREQRAARAQQPKERGLPKKAKPRTPEEFARDMAALMARPATGAKPINLSAAYQKAVTGKSSQWVTIKEVYEQAKADNPSLTPEAFMQFVQQQNDAGGVMISPVENVSTVEAAQPFVIGNAGVEMIVPSGTAASRIDEETDAEHLAAVEAGDMETAQRMADEAAKAAGLVRMSRADGDGAPTGYYEYSSATLGSLVPTEGAVRRGNDGSLGELVDSLEGVPPMEVDPLVVSEEFEDGTRDVYNGNHRLHVWKDYQVLPKDTIIPILGRVDEADPVTYDTQGNVIPLSQRFNPESPSILYAAPIDTQPRTGDSDAEAGGSEISAPISSELDARRKEAISAAVAQNDWGNYTREQKVAAAESFLAERVRGLGIFSPPHELLSRVTAGDPGGSYVRVDSADSKSLGVTINVGQGAGIDKYANLSPQEVFAHLYDIAQEEGIHVLQYMGLHRKWVESGAKGGTAGFLRLIEKEFKTTFDQINKARIDLQQTDPAAAQKIKDAMLASWNLYHAQDPVAGISGLWDRLGQSVEMQANFTLEMVRMLTQLKRQDFTTETGWRKFRSMLKQWLTDAINALRGVQDVFRSGMAGDLIQRQLADLEAALDGKPLPPVSRPAASRADDGEGVIDIGGEAEPGFDFTRARFAPPKKKDQKYRVQSDEEAEAKASRWIDSLGAFRAAELLMSDRAPSDMDLNVKNVVVGRLLKGFTEVSIDPDATEDEKTVARATNQRLGKFRVRMNQDPARALRQIGVQNNEVLQPIAPILAAEEVLADRGEKILQAQIDGGSEGAAPRVAGAAETATAEADERLEAILHRLLGGMRPAQTVAGAMARMFRGTGQRDQIIEEVAKALMLKARGTVVAPERKTALANLVSSLKSTLSASVKGDKKPAPERTLQDLLTSAFVNQVSEGPAFEKSWAEGRQKVLDMLIDMELDKEFNPAEKRLRDLRSKLTYLDAGSDAQISESAEERASLEEQIKETRGVMVEALKAVKAKTPELETQRDKMMPAAPTMAFDPVSSREAIKRAFEEAGYAADVQTGLDKSGKRSLSPEDALLNRQRAVDSVMRVFDESMTPPNAETQNDWPQARALALKAVNETLDSWEKQAKESAEAAATAEKERLLSEDSKDLERLVNTILRKILPGSNWSDILYDLPRNQASRLAAIKDRVAKHESLKNLTPEESDKLAKGIEKLWQRERLKAFQDELLKAGVLKAKTKKAALNVVAEAPELLRLMNLGVFNSSTFREAVAKRFGLKTLSGAQADFLRKLAVEAWDLPQGVLRNKKLKLLVEGLQHVTSASWSDVMNSYWIASVLSGLRTHFDTWGAVVNGLGTNLIQAGIQLSKGRGAAAFDIQAQWWKGLFDGMNEALDILRTGDPSFTKRFEGDLLDALNGERNAYPIAIGEKMWKSGSLLQKIPGALMMVVGRSMVAADHVNNTATTQGAMAVARAMNPELYAGKTAWTQKEVSDARKQAIAETTGGVEPETREDVLTVKKRTREILNAGLSEEHQTQASLVGDMAAFQNDPTGLFGGIYHAVKAGLAKGTRVMDEAAKNEEAALITRALLAVTAGSVHALTGTRFMRFGFNLGNEFMRYMPGSWLLNKGTNILGSKLSPMQQELLLGKNIVGGVLLATLYSLFGDDDESEDGKWHMEGPWDDLSRGEQNSRMSAGILKNSFWRRKEGKIERISYSQWPTAGLLAAVGGMLDEKRYKPEEWNQRGVAGHILQGAVTGLFQVQDAAAMQQLAELFSTSASYGEAQGVPEKLIKMGTNYAGGLVPTVVKDLDKWQDPRNFRADGVWEKLVREMPVARRFVNDGRPQFNRIGQVIQLHREPYSRLYTSEQADKAVTAYGKLLALGIDFPTPSTSRMIVKDGKKVPMDTLGKGVAYEFEKAVAEAYGKFLEERADVIGTMSVKTLDKLVRDRARRILDIETRKVQAKVNNP